MKKLGVTVLTGFLGAGKTTLLKNLLEQKIFRRYVVIVNEFAQIGIDKSLIIHEEESLFQLSNGCLCCEIRSDLVSLLEDLVNRVDNFDGLILETSGMASPLPILQTFQVDEAVPDCFELARVVTLVDGQFLKANLAEYREAADQIAVADLLLLNKCDQLSPAEQASASQRLKRLNPTADLVCSEFSQLPAERFLAARHPLSSSDEETLKIAPTVTQAATQAVAQSASQEVEQGTEQDAGQKETLDLRHLSALSSITTNQTNPVALTARHESSVTSLCLQTAEPINTDLFLDWIQKLVMTQGDQLIRTKGILYFYDETLPFVFQGVRNSLDGELMSQPESSSDAATSRISRLVLIGRELDAEALEAGFQACVMSQARRSSVA